MLAAPGRGPESAVETEWLASRVASLPAAQREAVVLVAVQGYPYADAAELVGRPLNTVKSDVHRGLAALRQMLEREEVAV
jgi:RNA polymerase sigma-70 factor (ECF subfamily)